MDKTVLVFCRDQREMVQRQGANMVICRLILLLAGRNASSVSMTPRAKLTPHLTLAGLQGGNFAVVQ
jgi:hypothetical protein